MMDNIRRVFLVDYENTSIRGLYGISCLGENCKVVVFCSSTVIQKAVEDVLKVYELRNVEISTFLLIKPGKNALDFMISTYLGYEVNESIDKEIFIVSSDHGFESAMEMAKQLDRRMTISSHRNIFECLPAAMRQGHADIEEALMLETKTPVLLLDEPAKREAEEQKEEPKPQVAVPAKKEEAPKKQAKEPTKKEAPKENVVSSLFSVFKKKTHPEPLKKEESKPVVAVSAKPVEKTVKKPVEEPKKKVIVEVIEVEEEPVATPAPVSKLRAEQKTEPKAKKKKEKNKKSEQIEKPQAEAPKADYATLSKNKRKVLRERIMKNLPMETSIPEKFHLGIASAICNSDTYEECLEKYKTVLGTKGQKYQQEAEMILKKYR